MAENEKCTCNEEEIEPHLCPYKEEIHDDYETFCKCCEYCTHECLMDI